jgi:hypothetical protein
MNRLIYVETSIPSFYFETRPEPENQARRNWTRDWWAHALVVETLVSSLAVIAELERSPEPKKSNCLVLIEPLPLLPSPEEVDDLVAAYMANKVMPADAMGDARHLALATWHGCDVLVTWNCRHLANANKTAHIHRINGGLGFDTPQLVTPLELLEDAP